MNNITNSQSNLNFTARMDIHLTGENANRLKNIAQMFEAQTKKFPKDTVELDGSKHNGYQIYHYDKGIEHENCCDITTEQWNKLFEKPDDFIAKKLVKLFNIFKKKDKELDRGGKYIVSVINRDKNNDPTDFEQKFWDILTDKVNKDRDIAAGKDSVLRNFKLY